MKFMKLGSKTDAFHVDGNNSRYVASDLATDAIVHVGDVTFHLHKFPLLSKSYRLQKLVLEASEDGMDEIYINDFPGGPTAFETCVKFCYGMTITLNPYNVVAIRCAAENLEMTEDVDKGNLIYKIEVFLNSSVFCSWKDSIIVMQTTNSLLPWSEELRIVGRCVDSVASKTSVDLSRVNWSYTYSKRSTDIVPMDWWVEDICELDIDLYKRVMVSIKSKGRMSSELIGEALKAYAVKWLPDSYDAVSSVDCMIRNRSLVETLIWLLPTDCSCRFLLKLLKIVILVEGGDLLKEELMNRISSQLHKASVKDLMIPGKAKGDIIYDIDLMRSLVNRFLEQEGTARDRDIVESEEQDGECILGQGSLLRLSKLVDGYLIEIASDPNLSISSFIGLSTLLPKVARANHDGLYTAIDVYLKEHPNLSKEDKKQLCSIIDVRKLSPEASNHAAQNDRLPLRLVVRVLFYEQSRAVSAQSTYEWHASAQTPTNTEDNSERPAQENKSIKKQIKSVRIEENNGDSNNNGHNNCKNKGNGVISLQSRSRRIFDKLWPRKGQCKNSRSSEETSVSSQSLPPINHQQAWKSSGFASRNGRRHSIS